MTDLIGGSSTTPSKAGAGGAQRHQKVAEMVKALDQELKKKLGNNFNSVRKAWLELDEKHIGYITAEEIARFLGASGQKRFDFTLLEILVKMRASNLNTRIFYKDFCSWLGSSIEPTEAFYFRHDS
jgi:Ca2+-binding EF-hand superfamily protein